MKENKIQNNIKNDIADTLFIPLLMKCNETHRKEAFFSDPYACEMVKKIEYDFSKYNKAVQSSIGVAVRAKYFDEMTVNFIQTHRSPVVVNVGCGLDTRYQRLGKKITDKAVLYELDLPEVIELRIKLLPASKNNIYIPNSMFDTIWMDMLKEKYKNTPILFIAEGVLMYFEEKEVRKVFENLSTRFNNSKILFDVTSTWMSRNSHLHDTVKYANAPFKLSIDDDKEIEKWASNLKLESVRHYGDFIDWKRSGFVRYWLMRIVPVLKKSSRLLCYKIY